MTKDKSIEEELDAMLDEELEEAALSDEVEPQIVTAPEPVVHLVSGVARMVKPSFMASASPSVASSVSAVTHIGKCNRATKLTSREAVALVIAPLHPDELIWCEYCKDKQPASGFVWTHTGKPLAGEEA